MADPNEKKRKTEALASFFGGAPSQKQPKLNFKVLTKEEYRLQEAAKDLEYKASKIKAEAAASTGSSVMADLAAAWGLSLPRPAPRASKEGRPAPVRILNLAQTWKMPMHFLSKRRHITQRVTEVTKRNAMNNSNSNKQ